MSTGNPISLDKLLYVGNSSNCTFYCHVEASKLVFYWILFSIFQHSRMVFPAHSSVKVLILSCSHSDLLKCLKDLSNLQVKLMTTTKQ